MANIARRVIQCDKAGNEIRSFESAKEAVEFLKAKGTPSLHRAIRYGLIAYGYRWKYEGEELVIKSGGTPGKNRIIIALALDSGLETTYQSISEASRELGVGISAIEASLQTCCKAKGYRFRCGGEPYVEPVKRRGRRVLAIDENGSIKEYRNVIEAAEDLGVTTMAIYKCLGKNGRGLKCKGRNFRYK